MTAQLFRYQFDQTVPTEEVEAALALSLLAVESLHGESLARLEVGHAFDAQQRVAVIGTATGVGHDFNRLFVGFITRLCGPSAFSVSPVPATSPAVA